MRLYLLFLRYDLYWWTRGTLHRLENAAALIAANESRTYVSYSTGEIVTVTGWNYMFKVKYEYGESAVLKFSKHRWVKCYLF